MFRVIGLLFALIIPINGFSATCRCQPNEPCWPNAQDWAGLAKQLKGKLIKPELPTASCQINASSSECSAALQNIKNPFFLEASPGGTETRGWANAWNAQASEYAVAAENTSDIAAAVNFSRKHNLRVVIKGTGHDYLGRSSAPNSLLIWTHKMRQVNMEPSFIPQGCAKTTKGRPAVTVSAGTRWLDTFGEVTTKHNRYVQGGGCTSVGSAGGFTQGGGFGQYSKKFGTGAAGILQAEIVTGDGKTIVANQCQNQDIFWAVRGGGGGTFGVVTKMTLMTHDLPKYFNSIAGKITAKNDEDYKNLVHEFLSFYRDHLNNEHWGEQFHFNPDNTIAIKMVAADLNKEEAEKAWLPLKTWVERSPDHYSMNLKVISIPPRSMWDYRYWDKYHPDSIVHNPMKGAPKEEFWWSGNSEEAYIYLYAHQTRWIPIQLFSKSKIDQLTDAFFKASRLHTVSMHVNKGLSGASKEAIKRGRETSTNPAVYDAAGLVIMAGFGNQQDKAKENKDIENIRQAMNFFFAITPNAGTYVNESDYFEKNWQKTFWGSNYKKLLEIKTKVDPNGLFYCHHCVGSEFWNDSGMCRV